MVDILDRALMDLVRAMGWIIVPALVVSLGLTRSLVVLAVFHS